MYLRLSPYQEILQGVLTDLAVNEGIIKITGKSGAGKTALCSQLFQELEQKGQLAVFFLQPPANATALQNNILDSLKLDTAGNFTNTLTAFLVDKPAESKPLVLIFDEAHHLDQQTFGAIRMLCNIQDEARALIRVIVCGTEEMDQKLATPVLRAVTQFLSQSFTLPYLTSEEMHDFCQGFWMQMAVDMKPMSLKAQHKLFAETKGHPGLLQARLKQDTTGAQKLERHNVEPQAVRKSSPGRYPGKRPGWIPAVLIIAGLVLVGGGYLFLLQNSPSGAIELAAPQSLPEVSASPVAAIPVEITPAGTTLVETNPVEVPPAETTLAETTLAETTPTEATNVSAEAAEVESPGELADLDTAAETATTLAPDTTTEPLVEQQRVETAQPVAAEPQVAAEPPLPEIEEFIAAWADSWQSRNVDAYLAHYHPDFMPAQSATLAEWQEQRRRVIGNAGEIMITVEPPEFTAESPDGMRVIRFWLHYSTATYADRTLKELLLVPLEANWSIVAENNLRTERD